MRVAVIGATGVLGRLVATELAARGDEVISVSRSLPRDAVIGSEHRRADLATGVGLEGALAGAEAVVDAANDSSRHAATVLVDGTRRLLEAEAVAGVGHHVAISIVGCDRVPIGYYRAKTGQEEAVAAGGVPWTLLRATQFHQLVAGALASAARARLQPRGPFQLQPIDPALVAARVADAVHAGPGGRLPAIAGPEVATLTQVAEAWVARRAGRLLPLPLPAIGKAGRALRGGALCDRAAAVPGPTFAAWLDAGGDR